MWLIVFQFQLRGGCASKCWARVNSLFHGRSPKEILTAICSSTTVYQVGSFKKNKPYAEDMWDLTLKFGGKDPIMIWIFLPVMRDYVIYFLSKLLWRDQSPERCGRLKVCPAPLPSLRQRSVFAAYVELSADFKMGPIDIKDRKTLANLWWSSVRGRRRQWGPY